MTEPGLIIIGSGPAGLSAAEAFREHNTTLPVHIFTDDEALPYERPPLSKDYLRGETDDVDTHPAEWFADKDIQVVTHTRIDSVDTTGHAVHAGGERYPYHALVFATGSGPITPPIPGGELALQLRSLADARRLRAAATDAKSAVVIGAGFIGCEAAASLAKQGVSVTVVAPSKLPQQKRLGDDAAQRIANILAESGVRYLGGVKAESISADGVVLDDGTSVDADLVLAAIGVEPRNDIARAAGLDLQDDRILVGADMRSSVDGVFAAGDVALSYNTTAARHLPVEHWGDAMDQGEVAGAGAAGAVSSWSGVPGFWTTIGEKTLKYQAWGDGFDQARLVDHGDGFTIWYETKGVAVGVLTCDADDDYELGEELITAGKPAPA